MLSKQFVLLHMPNTERRYAQVVIRHIHSIKIKSFEGRHRIEWG